MIDIEHRLTQCEDRTKSNTHRLDEMEKRQDDQEALVSAVATMNVRVGVMETTVEEIRVDVKEINSKSGKKWENLGNQLITILTGAVVGYFLAQIGLG